MLGAAGRLVGVPVTAPPCPGACIDPITIANAVPGPPGCAIVFELGADGLRAHVGATAPEDLHAQVHDARPSPCTVLWRVLD